MLKKLISSTAMVLGLAISAPAFASDLQDGAPIEVLAAPCAGCHGVNGVSAGPAPTIAGLSEKYFKKVMKNYRKDKGGSTIMNRIAKGYTKDETKKLGAYYASKAFVAADQKFDAALAAKGKDMHAANCESCHKKNGTEPKNNKGILAGQHMGYLKIQMNNFLSGTRKNRTMKKKLEKAGGADAVEALAHFYASVK